MKPLVLLLFTLVGCNTLVEKANTDPNKTKSHSLMAKLEDHFVDGMNLYKIKTDDMFSKIQVNSKADYEKIKITGRCKGLDGPEDYTPKLIVKSDAVEKFEAWTDNYENKSLIEKALVRIGNKKLYLKVKQNGCSHHGWSYDFYLQKVEVDNLNKAINLAVSSLKEMQNAGLLSEEHFLEIADQYFVTSGAKKNQEVSKKSENSLCRLGTSNQQKGVICSYSDEYGFEHITLSILTNELSGYYKVSAETMYSM